MVSLPFEARLFYIGLWNFADDYGCLVDEPARLKLSIFPADDIDAERLLEQLVEAGRIERHQDGDDRWLLIKNFQRHQKVDSRVPRRFPPGSAESRQIPPDHTESRPRNGREGSGKETSKPLSPNGDGGEVAEGSKTSPLRRVFDAWVASTGRDPARTKFDGKRRRLIASRLLKSEGGKASSSDGYPLEDLLDAVRGWRHSAHHRGENDRGKAYNDLELLLRDSKHIEDFRDLERGRQAKSREQLPGERRAA
jgi:hypothetical protein